jgi:hypothetical protein
MIATTAYGMPDFALDITLGLSASFPMPMTAKLPKRPNAPATRTPHLAIANSSSIAGEPFVGSRGAGLGIVACAAISR